jgi:hypothetical protein
MGGGRRAPFGVLMSPNRRVAHAKPTTLVMSEKMFFEVWTNNFLLSYFGCFVKLNFSAEFRSVPSFGIGFSAELGPFFCGKIETIPSL